MEERVDEVKAHAPLPAVLRVAAASGQGEGFVEPLARGIPLARERVQPGAGEQDAGHVMAAAGLAQGGEGGVQALTRMVKFRF